MEYRHLPSVVTVEGKVFQIDEHGFLYKNRQRPTVGDAPNTEDIIKCMRWLNTVQRTRGSHFGSYTAKHLVEDDCGRYVTQGALLVAAAAMGFRLSRHSRDELDCGINIKP